VGLEPALAALVMVMGIALTSAGVFAHDVLAQAVAPGALLTLVGGGWLGTSLARHDVRLLPGSVIVKQPDVVEKT
jgi:hypothetical protein